MAMEARSVLEVLALLTEAGTRPRVEGGWGIDALLGVQTRDHGDVDVVVDEDQGMAAQEALVRAGFRIIHDELPGHVSFRDGRGLEVDVTIIGYDRYGDGWNLNHQMGRGDPDYPQGCFSTGWIIGQQVDCLGPETQVRHHVGYEPEQVDLDDVEQLRQRFEVSVPESLRPRR
jgi:lincosamide nucleotidyltransferase A/C/D/E